MALITTLPWNYNLQEMPVDRAVLVKRRDNDTPFMAQRDSDEPEIADVMHPHFHNSTYGMPLNITDLECWLEVTQP